MILTTNLHTHILKYQSNVHVYKLGYCLVYPLILCKLGIENKPCCLQSVINYYSFVESAAPPRRGIRPPEVRWRSQTPSRSEGGEGQTQPRRPPGPARETENTFSFKHPPGGFHENTAVQGVFHGRTSSPAAGRCSG